MPADLAAFAAAARVLADATDRLDSAARPLGLAPASSRPWHEVLHGKLVPQSGGGAHLVCAVVGGTNIGKSVVFNHLVGERASASSPTASGTKHPTCLAPRGFAQRHDLSETFPGFDLVPLTGENRAAALAADDRDLLFWAESDAVPPNLLVLDTPDVDSDAPVNWARAAKVRSAADVLLAVLTQQKYNDAAVVRFFAEAGEADAAVVIVFNQVDLPEDEAHWPAQVGTFCERTGVTPELVFLAPRDRAAANELRLPFHERPWPPDGGGDGGVPAEARDGAALSKLLGELHFNAVKLRTLRGAAARVADAEDGVPAWLADVEDRAGQFGRAGEHLLAQIADSEATWPPVPARALVMEIKTWWRARRGGPARRVADAYDAIGGLVKVPLSALRRQFSGDPPPPLADYRARELALFRRGAERLVAQLERLKETEPTLRPRLDAVLSGTSRGDLLAKLKEDHAACDLHAELAEVTRAEMDALLAENARTGRWLTALDTTAVIARPALTVGLLGGGVIGTELAAAGVTVVADAVAGTAAAAVGEAAGSGAGTLAARLNARVAKIEAKYALRRRAWFERWVRDRLLGPLVHEVGDAARLPKSAAFKAVRAALAKLVAATPGETESKPEASARDAA